MDVLDLLETIADLESRLAAAREQFSKDCEEFHESGHKCRTCGARSLEEQEKLLAAAHAKAVHAAADECIKVMNSPLLPVEPCTEELCAQRILALTEPESERLYQKRIAEAVLAEVKWWVDVDIIDIDTEAQWKSFTSKRLASATAEVEKLKGATS
jgi:hypothetical protein